MGLTAWIVISIFVLFSTLWLVFLIQRHKLMKNGFHLDARITDFRIVRDRNSNRTGRRPYDYVLDIEYSYEEIFYTSKIKISEQGMENYCPELVNDKSRIFFLTIPLSINPEKPSQNTLNVDSFYNL